MSLAASRCLFLAGALAFALSPAAAADPAISRPAILRGGLAVIWGDPSPEIGGEAHRVFHLATDEGEVVPLAMGEEVLRSVGDWTRLHGATVEVEVGRAADSVPGLPPAPRPVASLRLLADGRGVDGPRAVTGSKPWISIACKFADVADEPEDQAFFQGMYANAPGRLDHYWREVSYDTIDIVGSTAIDWVALPEAQTVYVPTPGSGTGADLDALFDDCTAAADAAGVDFSNGGSGGYEGINMMFNELLDCCAWGGGRWATLDGVTKLWRTTWEPPWGYAEEGVIAHEMGHGFGLPHSNNFDGDGSPYDSPWDVMSAATGYAVDDPTYGRLGKHTIAHHKDQLGWVPAARRLEIALDGVYPLTLDHLALAATDNYRMARIPFGGAGGSYVVEARERLGGYDGALPGDAVLVFEIDPGRSQPAWLVDADQPPADYADNEGSMWRVGEVFDDPVNDIQISVDAASPEGFDVTIYRGTPPELDAVPSALDLGTVALGGSASATLELANNSPGPQTAVVSGMELTDPVSFAIDPEGGLDPCGSLTPILGSGERCSLSVSFAPVAEGGYSEELRVASNAGAAPLAVPLAGVAEPCPFANHLVLPDETVDTTVVEEACSTITAGPYRIVSPGDVTFRAGDRVILESGFEVGSGAAFAVEIF